MLDLSCHSPGAVVPILRFNVCSSRSNTEHVSVSGLNQPAIWFKFDLSVLTQPESLRKVRAPAPYAYKINS